MDTSYISLNEAKSKRNKDRVHRPQRTFSMRSFSGTSMTSWSVPYLNIEVGNIDKNQSVNSAHQCEAQNLVECWEWEDKDTDKTPVAHVSRGLVGQPTEDEEQQLIVVPLVGKVPGYIIS